MPATATEDRPTAMMTARIERAVESGAGSAKLLEQWLQGFDLPPLGMDEEPYVWILRGHAEAVERRQAEEVLATWLAELFEKQPDVEPLGEFPDRLLFNAFLLAAGLASPDELWEPLLAIYERRQLSGDYLGLDHRSSLRSALSQNQGDARLEPVWRAMATGKETDFLPGNAYNGFEALAMMPDSERGRGHPALEALGEALTYLVSQLDERPQVRGTRFKRLLGRLRSLYGVEGTILKHMSHVAEEEGWPSWAVVAVEEARPRQATSNEVGIYVVGKGEVVVGKGEVKDLLGRSVTGEYNLGELVAISSEQVAPADEDLLTGLRRELRTASGAKLKILRQGLHSVLKASRQTEESSTSPRSQPRSRS